jgi:tetratricopeptide (TPR) repeat protein
VTHNEWQNRMKSITEMEDSDPSGALELVLKLAEETRTEAHSSLSSWHEEQALNHAATIYLDMNRPSEAANIFEQLAQRHRGIYIGAGRSAAQLMAEAALARFRLGESEVGAKLVEEALRLFGQFPEPNIFLADAIREVSGAGQP